MEPGQGESEMWAVGCSTASGSEDAGIRLCQGMFEWVMKRWHPWRKLSAQFRGSLWGYYTVDGRSPHLLIWWGNNCKDSPVNEQFCPEGQLWMTDYWIFNETPVKWINRGSWHLDLVIHPFSLLLQKAYGIFKNKNSDDFPFYFKIKKKTEEILIK